jgi:hypothetical protein
VTPTFFVNPLIIRLYESSRIRKTGHIIRVGEQRNWYRGPVSERGQSDG